MKNKNSPEIRFSEFAEDWKEYKLSDISEKVTEKNRGNVYTETLTNSAEFGIVSQRDFFEKDISNEKNLDGYYVVRPDDFVYNPRISNFAPVGPIKRNNLGRTGVMSPLYYVFRVHNVNKVFLEKYFSSNSWHIFMKMNGDSGARSDRFAIKDSLFNEMPIPIPSNEEQTKIGEFFLYVDEIITLHKKEIEALKQLKQGFYQKIFPKAGGFVPEFRFPGFSGNWKYQRLGDIAETYSGGTPSVGNKLYYGGEIPFIRSGEINSESTELFITDEGLRSSSAKLVEKGDILYALYGATSGEVGISKINGAINQAILAIKPKFNNDSSFIMQWLRKEKNTIINTYLQGGQGNLSGSIVKDIVITLPPSIEEQTKIGEFFKELDATIYLNKCELCLLQETKKAFLQKLFL